MKNLSKGNIQIGRFKARLTVDLRGHWPPFFLRANTTTTAAIKNRKVLSFNRKSADSRR